MTKPAKRRKIIGWTHKVYGKCVMVINIKGERYYWFIKDNSISMIPEGVLNANQPQR